jgi:hypothetical protein
MERIRDRATRATEALIKHINRVLAKQGQKLKVARSDRSNLGQYYIIDIHHNAIVDDHVDILALARSQIMAGQRQAAAKVKEMLKALPSPVEMENALFLAGI